jgi:hypothetical protein
MVKHKEWAGPINWSKANWAMIDLKTIKSTKALDRQLKNNVVVKITVEITLDNSSPQNWDGVSREYYGLAVVKKATSGIAKPNPPAPPKASEG